MIQLSPKQIKTALIIIAILMGLLVVAAIFNAVTRITVKIAVSPSDATFTIDGKPAATTGEISLTKGKHTLKASRHDFADATKTIDTNDLGPGKKIFLILEPTNAAGSKWLDDHPDEVLEREADSGQTFSKTQKNIIDEYPIVSQLPRDTLDYIVDYVVEEDKSITFIVTVKPYAKPENKTDYQEQVVLFKKEANDFLTKNGIDINKAKITYKEQSQW